MVQVQCEHIPLCTNPAKEKCSGCGHVCCVKHIQLLGVVYTCDNCISREAHAQAVRKSEGQKIAKRGCLIIVGSILAAFLFEILSMLPPHSALSSAALVLFIGSAAVFWIGVIVWIVGLVRSGDR